MTSRAMTFSKSILLLIGLGMSAGLVGCGSSSSSSSTTTPPPPPPTPIIADGTYVYHVAGQNSAGGYLYYAAGAFKVASNAITAGEQDYTDYSQNPEEFDQITGGAVTTSTDGNIKITLTTADANVGVSGTETLDLTLTSATRGLITEYDSSATSSGELDLQTSASPTCSAPPCGYAFYLSGGDANGNPSGIGGIIDEDGAGTISGTGSVVDINDYAADVLEPGTTPDNTSTVGGPDTFGRVAFDIGLSTTDIGGIGLVGYSVDGNTFRLIENGNDPLDAAGFFGVTGGTAVAQGANVGTYTAAGLEGQSYVFAANGQDVEGYFQAAGVVIFGEDGTSVSGTLNNNDLSGIGTQAPVPFTGTYTVDAAGAGDVTLSLAVGSGVTVQVYLNDGTHGFVVGMDNGDEEAGNAYLQTVPSGGFVAGSFSGSYGLNTTGYGLPAPLPGFGAEADTVGPAKSDGVAVVTGTFDQNIELGAQTAGLTLTDGYGTPDPTGFSIGTLTGLDITTTTNDDNFVYYMIDTTRVVNIEVDPNQLTLGYFELNTN